MEQILSQCAQWGFVRLRYLDIIQRLKRLVNIGLLAGFCQALNIEAVIYALYPGNFLFGFQMRIRK